MQQVNTQVQSYAGAPVVDTLKALFRLTKPGVTALLTFTAITTAWAASGPWVVA